MSTAIKLLCADMAGTTVDDGGAVLDSFAAALDAAGLVDAARATALQYAIDTMGQSKIEVFRTLFDQDEVRANEANAAFERRYGECVTTGAIAPMPGAVELFAACRQADVKVCLTTGFSPVVRDAILDALGWWRDVDLVLSPADAGRGRPFPDMILTALIRLRIDDVNDVAVVGDTVSDLWSGHRSGAAIVAGITTGQHSAARLASAPHTHLIASLAELVPLLEPPGR